MSAPDISRVASPGSRVPVADIVPVVILNWNGCDDTVECLKSIRRGAPAGFLPVVVDNGSETASLEELKRACGEVYRNVLYAQKDELADCARSVALSEFATEDSLVLIQIAENLGFAKGNNVGIRFAELVGAEWVMLLNNDTVVAEDTFRQLREFLGSSHEPVAVTPQIRHFADRSRVQNCGGRLTYFGSRRYLFANADAAALPRVPYRAVTFATGCALMFKFRITGSLTEAFYFGEEDYEFALRLKQRGLGMACVYGAVVYHKGGTSIRRRSSPAGALLVSYVNRLLDTRQYYSGARWHATKILAYLRLPVLLRRSGIDPRRTLSMVQRIEAYLRDHQGVDRANHDAMVIADR